MPETSGDTVPKPAVPALPPVAAAPAAPAPRIPAPRAATATVDEQAEPRGCLFALSQPPLMIFLAVIGALLLMAAVHDLFLL
ncbi:hypothetical protein [Streptomyces sp. NPDC090025]|uniref:hypothetical protein n=1 Tax=Streptomyces sp. NPDC090025 TaxID=3365922 RepID=UPI003833B8BF